MKAQFAATCFALALPMTASAASYDFIYDFNGTAAVLNAATDPVTGTVLNVGDSYTVTLTAQAGFAWTVLSSFASGIDMSFWVGPCDMRTTDLVATQSLGGATVNTTSNIGEVQACVHLGGQRINYQAGDVFDQVTFTLDVVSAAGPTTILDNELGYWGAFWEDSRISYDGASLVPLPASLPLLLAGLAGFGLAWRRRKS